MSDHILVPVNITGPSGQSIFSYASEEKQVKCSIVNPLTHGAFFAKKCVFLNILVVFRLDLSQISFTLVENAFATWQLPLRASSIAFYDILARAWAEIKILRWARKWRTSLSLLSFEIFFAFPFSPFPLFLLQWLTFYWTCLQWKKLLKKCHWDGQFLPCSSQVGWLEILL